MTEEIKVFPLEKILTVSLEDYSNHIHPVMPVVQAEYDLVGVHAYGESTNLLDEFAKKVPPNAEVVVDYRVAASHRFYASGTALIPRKK